LPQQALHDGLFKADRRLAILPGMGEYDLNQLENRIEALLQAYRRLHSANRTLNAEWQAMTQRNQELRHRLEAAITRLKALEQQEQEA
jgi:uncharacterized protein (TIGR02449 family)